MRRTIALGLIVAGAALGVATRGTADELIGIVPSREIDRSLCMGPDDGSAATGWLTAGVGAAETAGAGRLPMVVPVCWTAGLANGGYVSTLDHSVTLVQMSDDRPQVGDTAMVAGLDGQGARLPLRDGPSRDATALARLPNGTQVTVIGEQNEWLRVVTDNGQIGWVRGRYLVPTIEPDGLPPTDDLRWTHWSNARFGMSIDYPAALFRPESAPENGDGQSFVTPDGRAGFFVFGQWDTMDLGIEDLHQMDLGTGVFGRITENRLSRYDYILAGQAEDRFTYRRALMPPPGDVLYVFEISYPAAENATFGPVIERMAESFELRTPGGGEDIRVPSEGVDTPSDPVVQMLTDELRALLERLP